MRSSSASARHCQLDAVAGRLPVRGACLVRRQPVSEIYRTSKVFNELRDASLLKGRCGRCEYRDMCSGGSRARAYATTGDYLAEDPLCGYQPG